MIEDLRAAPNPDGIKLVWQRPLKYTGGGRMRDLSNFIVLRANDTGPLAPLVELPITDQERFAVQHQFEYIDNETALGERYRYAIVSRTSDGYVSAPSNVVAMKRVKPVQPPNPDTYKLPTPTPLITP